MTIRSTGWVSPIRLSMLITLLLPLIAFSSVRAEHLDSSDERIAVGVYPPAQSYPGDNITIRVRIEALKHLMAVYIHINAYGSKEEGYDSWNRYLSIMTDVELYSGAVQEANYSLEIPSEASPGLVYATVHVGYKYYSQYWRDYSTDVTFQMTYLKNKAYENLQGNYINLLNEYSNYTQIHSYPDSEYYSLQGRYGTLLNKYNTLNSTYNSIKSEYDGLTVDLRFARYSSYIFAATTVILMAATSYLALRKTKAKERT